MKAKATTKMMKGGSKATAKPKMKAGGTKKKYQMAGITSNEPVEGYCPKGKKCPKQKGPGLKKRLQAAFSPGRIKLR